MEEWHLLEKEDILKKLNTSLNGLSDEEARRRIKEFGPNEIERKKRFVGIKIFLNQFKDVFILILLVATLISFLFGEKINGITISSIIFLIILMGFVQEYKSEKTLELMQKYASLKAKVIRDGIEEIIDRRELVPGDVVLIESGDAVPADGRLLEAYELKVDESVLTGESIPVEKTSEKSGERNNLVFMGTNVVYGRGKFVVTSTGMRTELGKIAKEIRMIKEEEIPLKRKLSSFAKKLGKVVLIACVFIFLINILREFYLGELTRSTILNVAMISIALAVSAVPEGLPAIVTTTLAIGARNLAKKNAIIRKLSSVETLGSVTVICVDKTGTITKGEMTAREIYLNGRIIKVTGVGYEPKGEFLEDGKKVEVKNDNHLSLLLKVGALCNNSKLIKEERWKIVGDPTEGCLLVLASKGNVNWKEERVYEIPFTSERKMMTTVNSLEGEFLVCCKGAPEVLIEKCSKILIGNEEKELDEEEKKKILSVNDEFASRALRNLGFAYKRIKEFSKDDLEKDLVFLGIVGIIDPPREEAIEAQKMCESAGIKTVMITGDHKLTAIAIAKEVGILKKGVVLTGEELEMMSDEEFERIVEDVEVYARVFPEQKLRIVRALKKKGHIVAMTGDGINDAPALKASDIGIAMGITGTDVAKEASHMILADDNFATIVEAVRQGRIIYENIRKFSFFLIRCNFSELALISLFSPFGLLPLTPAMILYLNLVTDGMPALSLAFDPPLEDVMKKKPRNPKEGLLEGKIFQILISFFVQFLCEALVFLFYLNQGIEKARTSTFMLAVIWELLIVWNSRSDKKGVFALSPFSNKYLLISVIISGAITILLLYTPIFQLAFQTIPLNFEDWILITVFSLSALLMVPEIFYGKKFLKWR